MPFPLNKSQRWIIPLVLISLAIFLLTFLVQLKSNKSYQGMGVDSSVFAYCGQQILSGHLLYRDCFDNKPPAVYYIDALAIVLFHPTPGGIWLFQTLWMAATGIAFFLIMRRIWGMGASLASTVVFMGTALFPAYYQNGNNTESYTLLPLVLILGALFGYLIQGRRRFLVTLGLLAAFAFLLKPTYISLPASAVLIVALVSLLRRPLRATVGHLGILVASGLAPLALVAAYFQWRGGLKDFIFAVFTHNTQYVESGFTWWQAKQTFLKFLLDQPMAYLFGLALAGALVMIAENWRAVFPQKNDSASDAGPGAQGFLSLDMARRWWMLAVLISIPFEIFFVTISGRDFGHYYLLPIPALSAAAAYLFALAFAGLADGLHLKSGTAWVAAAALVVFAIPWGNQVLANERPGRSDLAAYFKNPEITTYQLSQLEQYVVDHSRPDQSVLVWSVHPGINLDTGRRSPTRYVYALHVLTPTPTGSSGFPELIRSLQQDPPALILAQKVSSVGLPDFWSAGDSQCQNCSPAARQGLSDFKRYVASHYTFATQIFDWYIYRRTG